MKNEITTISKDAYQYKGFNLYRLSTGDFEETIVGHVSVDRPVKKFKISGEEKFFNTLDDACSFIDENPLLTAGNLSIAQK